MGKALTKEERQKRRSWICNYYLGESEKDLCKKFSAIESKLERLKKRFPLTDDAIDDILALVPFAIKEKRNQESAVSPNDARKHIEKINSTLVDLRKLLTNKTKLGSIGYAVSISHMPENKRNYELFDADMTKANKLYAQFLVEIERLIQANESVLKHMNVVSNKKISHAIPAFAMGVRCTLMSKGLRIDKRPKGLWYAIVDSVFDQTPGLQSCLSRSLKITPKQLLLTKKQLSDMRKRLAQDED